MHDFGPCSIFPPLCKFILPHKFFYISYITFFLIVIGSCLCFLFSVLLNSLLSLGINYVSYIHNPSFLRPICCLAPCMPLVIYLLLILLFCLYFIGSCYLLLLLCFSLPLVFHFFVIKELLFACSYFIYLPLTLYLVLLTCYTGCFHLFYLFYHSINKALCSTSYLHHFSLSTIFYIILLILSFSFMSSSSLHNATSNEGIESSYPHMGQSLLSNGK